MDIDHDVGIDKFIYNDTEIPLGGGTTFKEGDLNADFLWAKKVFEETNLEGYPFKTLELSFNDSVKALLPLRANTQVLTSDGQTYSAQSVTSVEHTWDTAYDKEAKYYTTKKLRWIIRFYNDAYTLDKTITLNAPIYFISNANIPFNNYGTYWRTLFAFDFVDSGGFKINSFPAGIASDGFRSLIETMRLKKTWSDNTKTLRLSYMSNLRHVDYDVDTSLVTDFQDFMRGCSAMTENPLIDTSSATTFYYMFYDCANLRKYNTLKSSHVTTMGYMFNRCRNLVEANLDDTSACTSFYNMFADCDSLESVTNLNLINATNVGGIFHYCGKLKYISLSNVRISLALGSGASSSYGDIDVGTVLNILQELWNLTGATTQTLTMSSKNLPKLDGIYVKLIDITDEMRAEDEYIDNKLPFVVCESTDEGAMLATDYALALKNWEIK